LTIDLEGCIFISDTKNDDPEIVTLGGNGAESIPERRVISEDYP
jgi:hypothetical protein